VGRAAFGFGVARSIEPAHARPRLEELCELATRTLGVHLYPHVALQYRDLSDGLHRGELGLAWMPPIPAIELEDRGSATALALPLRNGSATYHAALVVHESGPQTLAALRGTRAAWVDRDSASGYLVARLHLAASGFDVSSFFSKETFLHSHGAVIDAVAEKRVDVGATFCQLDPRTRRCVHGGWTTADGRPLKPLRVLATAGPIPNDAMVAANVFDEDIRRRLLQWLRAPSDRAKAIFFELLRAEGFRPAQPAHFEPLRKLLEEARETFGPPSTRRF
jgi:phosphonate transport system substrate-binding protein